MMNLTHRIGVSGGALIIALLIPAILLACGEVDMKVVKTGPTSAERGKEVTYVMTVTQERSGATPNPILTDTIPEGLQFVRAEGATCTAHGSQVECTKFGTPGNGGHFIFWMNTISTIKLTFLVTDRTSCGGMLRDTATIRITGPERDLDPRNDSSSFETQVFCRSDVQVVKSGADIVKHNQNVTYSIEVRNHGPVVAHNTVISDHLPGELQFVSFSNPHGACLVEGQLVRCQIASLNAGSTAKVTITAKAKMDTCVDTSITNTATISDDTNASNNSSSVTTKIECPTTDLSISKSGPSSVIQGSKITYQIRVQNSGPAAARDVVVTDALPHGTVFVSGSGPGGNCSVDGSHVTCPVGTMNPGNSATVSIVVETNKDAGCDRIINNVRVTGSPDSNTGNNTAIAETKIECLTTDLTITKSGPSTVVRGNTMTYQLRVTSTGRAAATNVLIKDTLPPGTKFISSSGPGSCTAHDREVECSIGSLNAGASVTVSLSVQTLEDIACGTIINHAEVSGTPDSNTSNNTTSFDTKVDCPSANLRVYKSGTANMKAGESIAYTIQVTNFGQGIARDIVLRDVIPNDTVYVSSSSSIGTCALESSTAVCTIGTLNPGVTAMVSIVLKTSVDPCSDVSNTAIVSTSSPDSTPNDNTSTYRTAVRCAVSSSRSSSSSSSSSLSSSSSSSSSTSSSSTSSSSISSSSSSVSIIVTPPISNPPGTPTIPLTSVPAPYPLPPQPFIYSPPMVGYKPPPVYPITGSHDGRLYANVSDLSSVHRVQRSMTPVSTHSGGIPMLSLTVLGFLSALGTSIVRRSLYL